jgi:hypothetical protein
MELARDLLDHQLVYGTGDATGRCDDVEVDVEAGYVGRLLSGGAVLADQLGAVGRVATWLARRRGRPLRRDEADWSLVTTVRHYEIKLALAPGSKVPPAAGSVAGGVRWSDLRRRRVITGDGRRMRLFDLRCSLPAPPDRPSIVGLVVTPSARWWTLGSKRVGRDLRFVPWSEVALDEGLIRLRQPFDALGPLAPAPDPGAPPREELPT